MIKFKLTVDDEVISKVRAEKMEDIDEAFKEVRHKMFGRKR